MVHCRKVRPVSMQERWALTSLDSPLFGLFPLHFPDFIRFWEFFYISTLPWAYFARLREPVATEGAYQKLQLLLLEGEDTNITHSTFSSRGVRSCKKCHGFLSARMGGRPSCLRKVCECW